MRKGQGMKEYLIILFFMAIVVFVIIKLLSPAVQTIFDAVKAAETEQIMVSKFCNNEETDCLVLTQVVIPEQTFCKVELLVDDEVFYRVGECQIKSSWEE